MKLLIIICLLLLSGLVVLSLVNKNTPIDNSIQINADKLTDLINSWRISQKLPPYSKDDRLCKIAKDRVVNDPKMDEHAGLYKKYSSYPYVIQENLGSGDTEEALLRSWLYSPAHAMTLKKDYKYSCVYCKGNYCSQIFSNL